MNARLIAKLLRRPVEAIHSDTVPSILDLIDFTDPTRSHEAKPSERLRQQYVARRFLRRFATGLLLVIACLALLAHFAT